MTVRVCLTLTSTLFMTSTFALAESSVIFSEDPIAITVVSSSISHTTYTRTSYEHVYELVSHLPFETPTPLSINHHSNTPEFNYDDQCHGNKLPAYGKCQIRVSFTPYSVGKKSTALTLRYANVETGAKPITTTTQQNWVGLIGADYQPNHYIHGSPFNFHDVFYVGTNTNNKPITNIGAELIQLKQAGYDYVRSYQTSGYSWIDLINQAHDLGTYVIYEAVIPQVMQDSGQIQAAVDLLNDVIDAVGVDVFEKTVALVFAGHENYLNQGNTSNINYLVNAITQLKKTLSAKKLTTPVCEASFGGNLVTPSPAISADMQTLFASCSKDAPYAPDLYPSQYGVTTPIQAVNDAGLINSLAWDYAQIRQQSFYSPSRKLLTAETGWPTAGTGQFQGYYCYLHNNCDFTLNSAAEYLQALYTYVKQSKNGSGALVFEAYDQPDKDYANPSDAENFYGVFDSNCYPKKTCDNTYLTPVTPSSTLYGCQGFIQGTLLTVSAMDTTNQPPFTVTITQENPTTLQSADMVVTVPTENRSNINIYPWPEYLVFEGASVKITGSATQNTCTVTIDSISNNQITFGSVNCDQGNPVSCANNDNYCLLPAVF